MPSSQATLRTLLRPCTHDDIPAIQAILTHYVLNTVVTFAFTAPSVDDLRSKRQATLEEGFPYIVAVERSDGGDDTVIIGYCYADGYRSERRGYRRTAELSLFCHPDYTGRGVGPQLLDLLIRILTNPTDFPDYIAAPRGDDEKTKILLAVMAHDTTAWNSGFGLRDFYLRRGFEEVGHLRKVGHKFDRW
jgi:L-amino acid N-acyltransferase YncA